MVMDEHDFEPTGEASIISRQATFLLDVNRGSNMESQASQQIRTATV